MLTGPPDFGLILAAGITVCSLARSLGRAGEGSGGLGVPEAPLEWEHQGQGEGPGLDWQVLQKVCVV